MQKAMQSELATLTGPDRSLSFTERQERRLDRLLTGVANLEGKAVTALLIRKEAQTMSQIMTAFSAITHWNCNPEHLHNYISINLREMRDSGFVIYEKNFIGQKMGYRISKSGIAYAQPVAMLALAAGDKYNIALPEMLGQSSSAGKSSAPMNRFKILARIYAKEARIAELAEITKVSNVSTNLDVLMKIGLLEYDTIGRDVHWSGYTWVDGKKPTEVPQIGKFNGALQAVAVHLSEVGSGDRNTVAKYLIDSGKRTGELKYRAYEGSEILTYLKRWGFVVPKSDLNIRRKSHVKITMKGKGVCEAFIFPTAAVVSESMAFRDMTDGLGVHASSEDRFAELAARGIARGLSKTGTANRRSEEEQILRISKFLRMMPERKARPKEIMLRLGKGAYDYLGRMVQRGALLRDDLGGEVWYGLKGGQNTPAA
jgi:predicted transcriptional regulator